LGNIVRLIGLTLNLAKIGLILIDFSGLIFIKEIFHRKYKALPITLTAMVVMDLVLLFRKKYKLLRKKSLCRANKVVMDAMVLVHH
jgi:hypothetical protein